MLRTDDFKQWSLWFEELHVVAQVHNRKGSSSAVCEKGCNDLGPGAVKDNADEISAIFRKGTELVLVASEALPDTTHREPAKEATRFGNSRMKHELAAGGTVFKRIKPIKTHPQDIVITVIADKIEIDETAVEIIVDTWRGRVNFDQMNGLTIRNS
ncbi:MAG: hypothetical protein AAB472_02960 [Patescibacteria group bacterium]